MLISYFLSNFNEKGFFDYPSSSDADRKPQLITSNCRQIWRPDQPMNLMLSSIVGVGNEQNSIVNKCLHR